MNIKSNCRFLNHVFENLLETQLEMLQDENILPTEIENDDEADKEDDELEEK